MKSHSPLNLSYLWIFHIAIRHNEFRFITVSFFFTYTSSYSSKHHLSSSCHWWKPSKRPALVADNFFACRRCPLRRASIPILPDSPVQFPKVYFFKVKLNINAVFLNYNIGDSIWNYKSNKPNCIIIFDACMFFFHDEKNLIVSGENNTF